MHQAMTVDFVVSLALAAALDLALHQALTVDSSLVVASAEALGPNLAVASNVALHSAVAFKLIRTETLLL